jgi:HAD superfamily hydrolase (TIGR01509 family)
VSDGQRALSRLPDPGALIFDLDGTLIDTVEARIAAWLDAFREEGWPASRERVAPLIGSDGKRLAREVAADAGHILDEPAAERVDARAGDLYDRLNRDPRPLDGAVDLLAALAESDLKWAIATSSREAQVHGSVAALRIPVQPVIVDGSQVSEAKPAPDLLLHAAERVSTPVERCWYVGDATWDMAAARAAGMVPIAVASGAVDCDVLVAAGGATCLGSLRELDRELRRRGWLGSGP